MTVKANASGVYLRASIIYALVSIILIAINPTSSQIEPQNDDDSLHPKKLKEHRPAQVKSRTIKTLSPSYDIISLNEPESILSLLTKNGSNRASVMENGFQENLAKLKKMARAKQQSLRRQQHMAGGSNGTNFNATLEDDIETINALIGMLMMANRKLIEQRNKLKDVSTGNHTTSPQMLNKRKGSKELKSVAKVEQRSSLAGATTTPDSRAGKTKSKTPKKATKIPKPIVTNAMDQSQNSSKVVSLKNETRGQELQADAQDYMLVRPGFDRDDGQPERVPFESQDQGLQVSRRDEQLPADMVGLHDLKERPQEDMMHAHKPVVAKDLLHVAHQPQSRSPTYPYDGTLRPENLFFTKPSPDGRNQVYEYLQQAPRSHDREDAHPREHPVSDERYRYQNDLAALQRHEPVVPPYNSLGWAKHPGLIGHPLAQRVGDINELGHVMGAPQLPPNEHPLLQNKHLAHYRPTPPVEGGDHPGQQVGDNAITNQPFISPIHQLLMAAKNQQAAALAYDRRRLEHEMNLQRQQDEMKRQHEANVERQRQQAQMELSKAKEKEQAKSEQEEQPDNGAAEPQQPQQPDQEQQHPQQQDGGAQGDSGAGEEPESGQNDDGGNAVDQQQPAQDEAGREEDKKNNERDFQNFQDFTGDTDFTDLFPPGILSEAEIKEMREQQQEQRRRQEQEEREKQEQAGEGDQQEGEGGGGEDQSGQPAEQANQAGTSQEEPNSGPKVNELMTGKSDGSNQTVASNLVQGAPMEGSTRQLSSNANSTALNNQATGLNSTAQQQPTRSTRGLRSHRHIGRKHDSYYHDRFMEPSLTSNTKFDDDDDRGRYDRFTENNNVARPLQYAYDEPVSGAYRPYAGVDGDR